MVSASLKSALKPMTVQKQTCLLAGTLSSRPVSFWCGISEKVSFEHSLFNVIGVTLH